MKTLILSLARGLRDFIQSFYTSKGHPQPIYFWATLFLSQTYYLIWYKIYTEKKVDTQLILALIGIVIALITLFNIFKDRGEPPAA